MNLYRFKFPISNYVGDGIFEQELFIYAEKCPTKHQIIELLKREDELNRIYEDYLGCWLECINSIENIVNEKFPYLSGGLVRTSAHCKTKWGSGFISVELVQPMVLDE